MGGRALTGNGNSQGPRRGRSPLSSAEASSATGPPHRGLRPVAPFGALQMRQRPFLARKIRSRPARAVAALTGKYGPIADNPLNSQERGDEGAYR